MIDLLSLSYEGKNESKRHPSYIRDQTYLIVCDISNCKF